MTPSGIEPNNIEHISVCVCIHTHTHTHTHIYIYIRININFRPLFVAVSVHTIILLWFVYYARHGIVTFIDFPSLNSVRYCGPKQNKKSDVVSVFIGLVSGQLPSHERQRSLPPGKDLVPIVQEAGWAPGPVWTGAENLVPTRIWSLDRPARNQSLYRLSYPAHKKFNNFYKLCFNKCICWLDVLTENRKNDPIRCVLCQVCLM